MLVYFWHKNKPNLNNFLDVKSKVKNQCKAEK